MANSPILGLPYLAASQAQKHVTVNEALRLLDGMVQLSVKDRNLSAPPGSPTEGARYLVASGASGAWSGWTGSIALFTDGAWLRILPKEGFCVWVEDEDLMVVRLASSWVTLTSALSAIVSAQEVRVAESGSGFATGLGCKEELLSGLSGASVDSSVVFPNRSIILGVTTKTETAITGATSYDCGIAGQPSKFGGTLGVTLGAQNRGVIGPEAIYADTAVRLTANGGNFTGGAVRIAIHYIRIWAE